MKKSYELVPTTSSTAKEALETDDNNTSADLNSEPAKSNPSPASKASCSAFLQHMKTSFSSLKDSPPELYVNFLLHFLESYAYFALSQILVIYLHASFHVSYIEVGAAYGLWGAAITFWGFVTGCINDRMGIRRSLLLGFSLSSISTLTLTLTTSKQVVYGVLFGLLPLGICLGIPMLTVAVKRFTHRGNRAFAFGLYYSTMIIAALLSEPVVDLMNHFYPVQGDVYWTSNRAVLLSVCLANLMSLSGCLLGLRQEGQVVEEEGEEGEKGVVEDIERAAFSPLHSDEVEVEVVEKRGGDIELSELGRAGVGGGERGGGLSLSRQSSDGSSSQADSSHDHNSSPLTIVLALLSSPRLYRFALFSLCLVNLNAVFRHLDATLPTYLLRCFGSSYPRGLVYAINPFIIVWLTPVIAAFTSSYSHYSMIKIGGYLTAASPFCLALATSSVAVVAFMVLLSLGEALWSPRLYDYTMSIAPRGQEATFAALAHAPLFLAKVPVGLPGGYLMSRYLAKDRPADGQRLWLIIGCLTATSPLLLTLGERWLKEEPAAAEAEEGKEKEPARKEKEEEED